MGPAKDSEYESLPEPFPETAAEVAAADWGDRTVTVVEEFADGGFAVTIDHDGGEYEPLQGEWYYAPPGAGESSETETWQDWWEVRRGHKRDDRKRRALLLGRLNERTGFWRDADGPGNTIPLDIALDGRKAIAAYLFVWQELSPHGIASKVGTSPETVQQYLSDYKAGRIK